MAAAAPDPVLLAALAAFAALRGAELAYNRRRERGLQRLGARAVRPDAYAGIVAVHALWFAAPLAEAWAPWTTRLLLAPGLLLAAAGLALRYASMWALGARWSTRVWVLDQPLVARGPYRVLRHPIYVGVSLELVGLPLAFGAWGTLLLVLPLHAWTLRRRIATEDRALRHLPS